MSGLITVICVGLLIVFVVRRIAKPRAIVPAAVPEIRSIPEKRIAPPQAAPAAIRHEPPTAARASVPPTTTRGATRYILGASHDRAARDATKAMLGVMSGRGLCTPRDD